MACIAPYTAIHRVHQQVVMPVRPAAFLVKTNKVITVKCACSLE